MVLLMGKFILFIIVRDLKFKIAGEARVAPLGWDSGSMALEARQNSYGNFEDWHSDLRGKLRQDFETGNLTEGIRDYARSKP